MRKDRISYIFSGNKNLCTGCGACVQVCSRHAISMQKDEEGFLFPDVDMTTCIDCGLCEMTCPVIGDHQQNSVDNNQKCYIATTQDESSYKESASIGICTMLSRNMVLRGGHVFGSFLDENTWTARHIEVTDLQGVERIRNSKYLQSDTGLSFTKTQKLLLAGEKVLYIGTPCQIAGLKAFLRKPFDGLYTIDLFCHGVFSPLLMPYEVMYWEKMFDGKICNFRFRSKRVYKHANGGMVNFDLQKGSKLKHIERFAGSSPTYRCFAYSGDGKYYNHRLSCYDCPFRSIKRYADITVGDPWFVKDSHIQSPRLKSLNAVRSIYSINTPKGEKLIEGIRKELIEEEMSVDQAFCQPAVLPVHHEVPSLRYEIYNQINKEDYGLLVEKVLNCNLKKSHSQFHVQYRKSEMKRILKTIVLWNNMK